MSNDKEESKDIDEPEWIVVNKEDSDTILELIWNGRGRLAIINKNGCVNYVRIEVEGQDGDIIHFCDIDQEIKMLELLRDKARKHFGEHWNED